MLGMSFRSLSHSGGVSGHVFAFFDGDVRSVVVERLFCVLILTCFVCASAGKVVIFPPVSGSMARL